ncbi:MAG TPA: hypothetical protein VIT44_06670 [Cyclobacteriaceae bacterium]
MVNALPSEAEFSNQELDLTKIRHEAVKKFMRNNGLHTLSDFAKVIHSCEENVDTKKFHRHVKSFLFKAKIADVWASYKTIGPVETCNGSMLGFGLQYSRRNHKITYHEDDHGVIDKGQIVILNLKLLWNLVNIAVGHEITEINEEEKFIKMCYIEGGASKGWQFIRLKERKDGFTEVMHETFYKSKSDFRDKRLYPMLHGLIISEFHKNVQRKLGIA